MLATQSIKYGRKKSHSSQLQQKPLHFETKNGMRSLIYANEVSTNAERNDQDQFQQKPLHFETKHRTHFRSQPAKLIPKSDLNSVYHQPAQRTSTKHQSQEIKTKSYYIMKPNTEPTSDLNLKNPFQNPT